MLIICISIFFTFFGLIMVYSSSAIMAAERYGDPFLFLKKQIVWVAVGIMVMLVLMQVNFDWWQYSARVTVFTSLVLLIAVLVIGRSVSGAQRWLQMGPFNLQPSEFAKIAMVIGLADFLDRKKSKIQFLWKGYVPAMVFILIYCGLIMIERDLGTPVVLFMVGASMLFISATRLRFLLASVLAVLPVLYYAVVLVPYRWQRVVSFLNPWDDPQGSGYQIIQSLVAIGSGGFTGKGLGGSEAKLLYIPAPHTDFIFSIISEEIGFLGVLLLLLLFVVFAIRGMAIAKRSPNLFGSFLAAGITMTIVYQVLLNIAVVTGCLPTKGLALPFLSFGGSSLIFTLAGIGIILNISRYTKK